MNREFSQGELSVRIKWLIVGRIVLLTVLLGTLVFFQHRYNIYSFRGASLYYFALFIYILSGVYWYLLQKTPNLPLFAYLQVAGDILLVTFLVYLTGGIDSGLSLLYHLTIISASIILYRRGGYLSASLASILYGGMLDMQYYNALMFVRSQNFTAGQVLYQVIISILSFYTIAFFSGYLSERLRKTRQELQEKSTDFEDLRVFQDHILRSVGSGIVTLGMDGTITSWNPAAEQITGYSFPEIKDRWQEIFGTSIKGLFGHTEDLKERSFNFDGEIIKSDGSKAILGMTASLLRDDRNNVRGIILIFQDVTRMVEMEERIRRQERLATVGSLAAGIAHEIRNPLASLSGSIQVLQGELDLKGDNRHLMDIVLRETDRLNTIITEFLEYARPRTSSLEEVSPTALFQDAIMLFKNSRDFKEHIRIICDVDDRAVIKGDPHRLRQVLWNLLINSCQAMPDGGEVRISATRLSPAESDAEWLEIIFSDTGTGIELEHREKIFDPFFTTKTGGTGLGLAIVYRIIEDHGGTIDVTSELGKGTRFRIRLPMPEVTTSVRQG